MAEKTDHKNPECLQIEQWIQQFIAVYGHGAITRFSERRLHGVSLVRVIRALELGTVTEAHKISASKIDCKVEYVEDDDAKAMVTVVIDACIDHSPPELVINFVEERKESGSGTDHAA
jgi:hypothetical protein